MSMFNIVFTPSVNQSLTMAVIGARQRDFPRFRDAWVEKDPEGKYRIAVYCRMGEPNRGCFDDPDSKLKPGECGCPACSLAFIMANHPLFQSLKDDSFDTTYTTAYFSLLEEDLAELPDDVRSLLLDSARDSPRDMDAEWQYHLAHMDEVIERNPEGVKGIVDMLQTVIEGAEKAKAAGVETPSVSYIEI